MKRIYILCEGVTEESFINNVLYPYLIGLDILIKPIVCLTGKKKSKNMDGSINLQKFRGGAVSYQRLKNDIIALSKQEKNAAVTTMFDYYGMPSDTPCIDNHDSDIYKRIISIENAIDEDIGMRNFFFHFTLNEFEGLLFSKPESFAIIADDKVVNGVRSIRDSFDSPEHINNSPQTAPSKRLECLIPNYAKVKNGTILSKDMGIDTIIKECRHFRNWILKIKDL